MRPFGLLIPALSALLLWQDEARTSPAPDRDAVLHYNQALAALEEGSLVAAEVLAEKAAAAGGAAFAARRDFLYGNAAYARSLLATAEAQLEDPDPTALARAIAHVESALEFWKSAAGGPWEWPEARRNAERAMQHREILLRLQEEEARRREESQERSEEPTPPEPEEAPPDPGDAMDAELQAQAAPADWTEEDLARLLQRLEEIEGEKRAVRQRRRERERAAVERDW